MKRPSVRLGVVVVMLALALGLKLARYGQDQSAAHTAGLERIRAVMAAHGWQPSGKTELDGGVYEQLTFRHDGCPDPVVVALLGGNAEGHTFFRRSHAGDVMIVQGGAIVERPSGLRRQVETLVAQGGALLGIAAAPVMPVLAIAPAADAETSGCRGPARTAWRSVWNKAAHVATVR